MHRVRGAAWEDGRRQLKEKQPVCVRVDVRNSRATAPECAKTARSPPGFAPCHCSSPVCFASLTVQHLALDVVAPSVFHSEGI